MLFFKINSNSRVANNLFFLQFDISDDAQESGVFLCMCARMYLLLYLACI